ncbi:MAG: NifU family protein [Saprospiraceae bacterium]
MNDLREKDVIQVLSTLLPAMETDGGGVEFVAIEGTTVMVRMKGSCLICPSLDMTMKFGITETLKEKLPWVEKVLRVN